VVIEFLKLLSGLKKKGKKNPLKKRVPELTAEKHSCIFQKNNPRATPLTTLTRLADGFGRKSLPTHN